MDVMIKSPVSPDTTMEAARIRFAILRRIGFAGRVALAIDASDGLRSVVESGVRRRHPEYDRETARLAAFRLSVGTRLFRLCFPGVAARA